MPDIAVLDFVTALALVLVLEGLSLAAFPNALYRALLHMAMLPREVLRWGGVVMAALGVFLIYLLRG